MRSVSSGSFGSIGDSGGNHSAMSGRGEGAGTRSSGGQDHSQCSQGAERRHDVSGVYSGASSSSTSSGPRPWRTEGSSHSSLVQARRRY